MHLLLFRMFSIKSSNYCKFYQLILLCLVCTSIQCQNSCSMDAPLTDSNQHTAAVSTLKFNLQFTTLVTTANDNLTKIWQYDKNTRKLLFQQNITHGDQADLTQSNQYNLAEGLELSDDASKIFIGGTSQVLNIESLLDFTYQDFQNLTIGFKISSIKYGSMNNFLLVAGTYNNSTTALYNIQYSNNLFVATAATDSSFGPISSICLSVDETTLIASSGLNTVGVFLYNKNNTKFELQQLITTALTKNWKILLSNDKNKIVMLGTPSTLVYSLNSKGSYQPYATIATVAQDASISNTTDRLTLIGSTGVVMIYEGPNFVYNQNLTASSGTPYSISSVNDSTLSFIGYQAGQVSVLICCPNPYRTMSSGCSCNTGYTLEGQSCRCQDLNADEETACANCKSGYALSNSSCQLCSGLYSNCQLCNSTTCTGCMSSYYLNGINCTKCTLTNCQTCTGNVCSICISGYVYSSGSCVNFSGCLTDAGNGSCSVCQSSYFTTSNSCSKCGSGCLKCTSATSCSYCDTNNGFALNNQSMCSCRAGYFMNNNTCTSCSAGCLVCSSANTCLSCNSAIYFSLSGVGCVCFAGYFLNQQNQCQEILFRVDKLAATSSQIQLYIVAIGNISQLDPSLITSSIYFYDPVSKNITSSQTLQVQSAKKYLNNVITISTNNPNLQASKNAYIELFVQPRTILSIDTQPIQTINAYNEYNINNLAAEILVPFLMLLMLGFYVRGYKNNYVINTIQKISLLRFCLAGQDLNLYSFMYSLRFSYFCYGNNIIQTSIPSNHVEYSVGSYYLLDVDATLSRNAGIPIIISLFLLATRVTILILERILKLAIPRQALRGLEYLEKIVMFPILFFAISNITFDNQYGIMANSDANTYRINLTFSILYLIYYIVMVTLHVYAVEATAYTKIENACSLLFDICNSVIIVNTVGSPQVLVLILLTLVKTLTQLYLNYKLYRFMLNYYDTFRMLCTAFEIALIVVLYNANSSIQAQALLTIIVILSVLHAILFQMRKNYEFKLSKVQLDTIQLGDTPSKIQNIQVKPFETPDAIVIDQEQKQQFYATGMPKQNKSSNEVNFNQANAYSMSNFFSPKSGAKKLPPLQT